MQGRLNSSTEETTSPLGTALSRVIFTIRERYELTERISAERFSEILSELNYHPVHIKKIQHRINFSEGELKIDDLLARMEVIRATVEFSGSHEDTASAVVIATSSVGINGEGAGDDTHRKDSNTNGIILANSYGGATDSSPLDPWRRTVSKLSMTSLWGGMNSSTMGGTVAALCHVDVVAGGTEGSFLDRHQTYLITISSTPGQRTSRRYRDFSWLREALVYRYPFRIIPQIPRKHSLGSTWMTSDEFMASRRRGLEEFLFLVINHPILQRDPLVTDFLSIKNYQEVRSRAVPVWQEEVQLENSPDPLPTTPPFHYLGDPTWEAYTDAQEWASCLKTALLSLKNHLNELMGLSQRIGKLLGGTAEAIQLLLQNTQIIHSSEGEDVPMNMSNLKIPDMVRSLASPHAYLADSLERDALRLELFQRLIVGCLEMIHRIRKIKYDRFGWLSDKIVAAQATAEKLRIRDGNVMTPELERALSRVNQYQRELYYHSKRNEFADACLRQELGWVVRICTVLPEFFTELQATLHQNYRLAMELTTRASSSTFAHHHPVQTALIEKGT